ncbi:MAG: HAD-IIB family hydrolase [Candidatus Curtissbacteria bacterium]|nr:HAD-IIB family hydrolase [Candidatus Curtissbacteria bacterium]
MKTANLAWLFDVDGVLTNSEKKKITEPAILEELISLLKKNEPVALVTGRSGSFMSRQVIEPLASKIKDVHILQNFIAVGEKGAVITTFENGDLKTFTTKDFAIPRDLEEEVNKLVEEKYSNWMFIDETKETMISVEMKDGLSIQNFTPYQHQLDSNLEELLNAPEFENKFKIVSSRISTDIQDIIVGKDYATEKVLQWLQKRKIVPKKFICFGDSGQDIDMARYIYEQGLPVEFVFVGEEHLLDKEDYPFPVVLTHQPCEKGTLEYLIHDT